MAASATKTVRPRGISRIDQDSTRTHGWFVRVGYAADRKGTYRARHTKYFGDATHGGKKKALEAAIRFVNGLKRKKSAPPRKVKRRG